MNESERTIFVVSDRLRRPTMAGKPNAIDFAALARKNLQEFAQAAAAAYVPVNHTQPVVLTTSAATANSSNAATSSTSPTTTSSSNATSTSTPALPAPVPPPVPPPVTPKDITTTSTSTSETKTETTPKSTDSSDASSKPLETKTTPNTQQTSPNASGSKQSDKKTSDIQPSQLKPPPEYKIDWKQISGPQFVVLNVSYDKTFPLPAAYHKASGSEDWNLFQAKIDECLEFITKKCSDKLVFVVCSGGLGRVLLPSIDGMSQVYGGYVYCADVYTHKQWGDGCAKVRVVCDHDGDILLPQLAYDCAHFYYKWAGGLIEKGDKGKAKENLEKALDILKNCTKGRHDKAWESKIADELKRCS